MAVHLQRLTPIVSGFTQLVRSLVLLAHIATVFVEFVGRTVQWIVNAMEWTCLFARYTVSVFDSIYRGLHWMAKGLAGGIREPCSSSHNRKLQ